MMMEQPKITRGNKKVSFWINFAVTVSLLAGLLPCSAFLHPTVHTRGISKPNGLLQLKSQDIHVGTINTQLSMSSNDEGGGGGLQGILFSLLGATIILLFVGTSFLPMMDGGGRDLSIADSVVTKQDAPEKLKNYEATGDRLSRSSIQEKLNTVPVFYLVDKENVMGTNIFMSYQDASDAAGLLTVKATTLDQVTYPLVLKRGRMRMAPPPDAVQKAEAGISESSQTKYRLVPSKSALKDAASFSMDVADSDIPLFVADRLAFASNKGPQLPLFLEKADCETSYNRLRESSSKLPETPNIRSTTLMETLNSMEKGTRPGVSQLAFYSSAEDLIKATDMMMEQ
ncbi:expressed unknown protein [Seminavis robusta]|uniref:Uncharacterized protein n=1 Tax=Seminavis robusta TaxID=568900 RepID=A0A9N8EC31_9STRA|nr:expressed unknown protein [Seminavis robusta]|eukprot:Sro730_g194060.1 n/a (342) ;mRNA; f:30710-31814